LNDLPVLLTVATGNLDYIGPWRKGATADKRVTTLGDDGLAELAQDHAQMAECAGSPSPRIV